MLGIITFINKFGYTVIENAATITTDIQNCKKNFSRALQTLIEAYFLEDGEKILKEYLSVWEIKVCHSKGYLIDDIVNSMCYETDNFIADLISHFYN